MTTKGLLSSAALTLALSTTAATVLAQAPLAVAWTRIPAGSFQMGCVPADMRCDGDEQPRHAVTVRAFEIMTTEATLGMMRAAKRTVADQPGWSSMPNQPVAIVSWDDAAGFCKVVGGRLPTEAEWEYAARGGRDGSIYPWGDTDPTDRDGAASGAAFETDGARPVRSFAANGFGLYDMAGNVWEWVADGYGSYGVDSADASTEPTFRVVRGGSYGDDPRNLRISNRNPNRPANTNVNVGFRCARDVQ